MCNAPVEDINNPDKYGNRLQDEFAFSKKLDKLSYSAVSPVLREA